MCGLRPAGTHTMLPLDDPRWAELSHRMAGCCEHSELDPVAPIVPEVLARLLEAPSEIALFSDLWPYLCSEGSAWDGAYAVVPYAVELARRLPPEQRLHHLFFVGLVAQCSEGPEVIPPYLLADYQAALSAALPLVAESLLGETDRQCTRYWLATAAALKGHLKLAVALTDLDGISDSCPECGACIYPEELQAVITDEQEGDATLREET